MKMLRIVVTVVVAVGVGLSLSYLRAQSFGVQPKVQTLAQCVSAQPPAANGLLFCNVAGDSNNPDGMYVSANAQPYFRVAAAVAAPAYTQFSCTSGSAGNTGISGTGCTFK